MKVVVLLGPPGSGKGTQAQRIVNDFAMVHLSTGDVFREAIKNQTPLGKDIKAFVDGGKLVPDELVSAVVFEKCKEMASSSFLLDGYPRTVGQAKAFQEFLVQQKGELKGILFFDVEFSELVRRLSSRRQCPKCKAVFNLALNPPKKGALCDNCQTELIHRPDDQPEIVQKRLDVYRRETEPILDFYKAHPRFKKLNAAQDIEKVFSEVKSVLSSFGTELRKEKK